MNLDVKRLREKEIPQEEGNYSLVPSSINVAAEGCAGVDAQSLLVSTTSAARKAV